MSLDIAIKVDPGDSLLKVKQIESGLASAERKGQQANRALAESMRPVAKGFAGVAEAIKRETQMLDKIHGPARQHAEDLKTLDALMRKNAISAKQYADQVARVNREMANSKPPSGMMGTIKGAMPMAMGAVGAGMGAAMAVEGHLQSMRDLEDRVTSLTNRAQKFTTAGKSVNDVLSEQIALAHRLHTTGGNVIGVYDAVSDATERLSLTTQQQIRLTETLGKAALLNGQSLDTVGARITALSNAFETGGNAGGQLRILFKENKDLADALAATLNMTKAQIIDAANKGTLSYGELVDAMVRGSGQIDTAFTKVGKKHSEYGDQFKEGVEIAMAAGEGFYSSLRAGLDQADGDLKKSSQTFAQWSLEVSKSLAQVQLAFDAKQSRQAKDGIVGLQTGIRDLIDTGVRYGHNIANMTGLTDSWRVKNDETAKAVRGHTDALREHALVLALLKSVDAESPGAAYQRGQTAERAGAQSEITAIGDLAHRASFDAFGARESQLKAWRDAGKISGKEFAFGMHEAMKAAGKLDNVAGLNLMTRQQTGQNWAGIDIEGALGFKDQARQEMDELAAIAEEKARQTQEAWARATGQIAGNFARMAMDGEKSWEEMVSSMLRQLAILGLQMAAMQMGGVKGQFLSGALGALGGGAHGFDHLVGRGAGPVLPGFAHGGDMVVGGGGGVDSRLAMFRVSPNESIHVRTPQQREAARTGGKDVPAAKPGRTVVNVIAPSDPRELTAVMDTHAGERAMARINRKFRR
jgi:tape measure domain-containing protein